MATQKGRNWSSGDIVTAANLSSVERGVSAVAEEYTPTTWANGNTVTAAALNNIEQGIANASGGGTSWTTLTEESVTVGGEGGNLTYNTQITADTIKVTFNGTEYTVSPSVDTAPFGTCYTYGAQFSEELDIYDYSTYPFSVVSTSIGANTLHTETAGTYSIKIEAPAESGSSDFSTAEVTIVNNTEEAFVLHFPNISDNRIFVTLDSADIDGSPVDAVLYKDACEITYTSDVKLNISVSGSATVVGKGRAVIATGDCTITISDAPIK